MTASEFMSATARTRLVTLSSSKCAEQPPAQVALETSICAHAARLSAAELSRVETLLRWDVWSEYDSRFLGARMRDQGAWSPALRAVMATWEADETLHYRWFEVAYGAAFPERLAELRAGLEVRGLQVNFQPFEDLLRDEFATLCLVAYDELATVGAFRACRPDYALLGPQMLAIVREVTRDEGRHYASFADLIKRGHAHRLHELPQILARIRALEGTPYGNTFVLDHDCALWADALRADALRTGQIFDRAEQTLTRSLLGRAGAQNTE